MTSRCRPHPSSSHRSNLWLLSQTEMPSGAVVSRSVAAEQRCAFSDGLFLSSLPLVFVSSLLLVFSCHLCPYFCHDFYLCFCFHFCVVTYLSFNHHFYLRSLLYLCHHLPLSPDFYLHFCHTSVLLPPPTSFSPLFYMCFYGHFCLVIPYLF